MRRATAVIVAVSATLPLAWAVSARAAPAGDAPAAPQSPYVTLQQIRDACGTFQPFYAVSRFVRVSTARDAPRVPAIVAFQDTAQNVCWPNCPWQSPVLIPLAEHGAVGAVYGLAYDAPRAILYASAYLKRSTAFGPGGAGQIYAIDLSTGRVRELATMFAGVDPHDYVREVDTPAAIPVGRFGLGDIDLDDLGETLFVMSLSEGRVYRIRVPDGQILGSFRHGAANESWVRDARPFGLGYHKGWLYHGVVNSVEFDAGQVAALVYRSRPDGSQMQEIARFPLTYPRVLSWSPWNSGPGQFPGGGTYTALDAQPMLTDIEFTPSGEIVLGLRDRVVDMIPGLDRLNNPHPGSGDTIPLRYAGGFWTAVTAPEHYRDELGLDEATWGGLAPLPGYDITVSNARAAILSDDIGASWMWNAHGGVASVEMVDQFRSLADPNSSNGLGDVEVLCARSDKPDPRTVPTATAFAATATSDAGRTATAIALTPTVMPLGTPSDFDRVLDEACLGFNPYAATVCFGPSNLYQQYFDTDTVMIFTDTPADTPVYAAASFSSVASVWGLGYDAASHRLFAAAHQKRMGGFTAAGPGAIFQMTVRDGSVSVFATVPNAGSDYHGDIARGDAEGRNWVGKSSLGDVDVDQDARELFVANLFDGFIYRYALDTGALLGSFSHGAAAERWAPVARPFGLAVRAGRLYHGVVNTSLGATTPGDLLAVVYESALDGSAMHEVARIDLKYPRGSVTVPGVINQPAVDVPLDWQSWRDGSLDINAGRAQTAFYPQPQLSDIEFAEDGDMLVAIRDRFADASLGVQVQNGGAIEKPGMGLGDVLRLPVVPGGWGTPLDVNQYRMPGDSTSERGYMGGLGQFHLRGITIANRLRLAGDAFLGTYSPLEGALWYDNDANTVRRETTCQGQLRVRRPTAVPTPGAAGAYGPQHSEWIPGRGMGDVEVLCGPTPSATPTRTAGPSPSPTPSPTATSMPEPIYLPISVRESCLDRKRHADVVLVLDTSTSMRGLTSAGRPKSVVSLEAAAFFISLLDFTPNEDGDSDQVSLVGFNDTAWLQAPLTSDPAVLAAALAALPSREHEGTRLDLALERGRVAVHGPGHRTQNKPLMILLTDGLPNRVPTPVAGGSQEDTVLEQAALAKTLGVMIVTIGIGDPASPDPRSLINPELLGAVASRPDLFYQTPDAEALQGIYNDAAVGVILCPRGRHRWAEPWP